MELKHWIAMCFWAQFVLVFGQIGPKYAVLIGVSQFKDAQWEHLHGREEMDSLAKTLVQKGFLTENINLLTDRLATKNAIKNALEQLATVVEPGGVVYVHFSLHGQRLADDNIDPREESDGLDECLVPWDCPFFTDEQATASHYAGENHIRDDEIGIWTDAIRKKLGESGQLVVVFDACYSGTATRRAGQKKQKATLWLGRTIPDGVPERLPVKPIGSENADQIAPMLAIFASLPDQFIPDLLLTSAVQQALGAAGPGTTCGGFFTDILSIVKARTATVEPYAEGLEALGDIPLFGGGLLAPRAYFQVAHVYHLESVGLDQGAFANLYPGTEVRFYPAGTAMAELDKNAPFAEGIVTKSAEMTAKIAVKARSPYTEADLRRAWVYVTKWVISDRKLAIKMPEKESNLLGIVREKLAQNENFKLETGDVELEADSALLRVYDREGLLLHEFGTAARPGDIAEDVERFLLQYQRFVTLKALRYSNEKAAVTWSIYPARQSNRCEATGESFWFTPETGTYDMRPGDCFGIELTNNSRETVYFSMLNFPAKAFLPNTDLVLIPLPGDAPEAYSIPPGKTWKSSEFDRGYCWIIEPDAMGLESLKLVTALSPVHLREAMRTRAATRHLETVGKSALMDVQDVFIAVKK